MKTKIIILIVLIAVLKVSAEIRFVSKTGSSTAPYISWATASDSIQKAINICKPGDTIYVGKGSYEEQLVVSPGLALIGSGSDSCIIDTRRIAPENNWQAITLNDSTSIENFCLYNAEYGKDIVGIRFINSNNIRILNNKIINTWKSISAGWSNMLIKGNSFYNDYTAIDIFDVNKFSNAVIEDNIISGCNNGIILSFGANSAIRDNFIYMNEKSNTGIGGSLINNLIIENNLIVANKSLNNSRGIQTSGYNSKSFSKIINNTLYGDFSLAGIMSSGNDTMENNYVSSTKYGIWRVSKDSSYSIKYNNTIGKVFNYFQITPDSTNLSVNPMFINTDSLDFHLQMFSPMIHAGDPEIKNVDGTRSDIGLFGGPYGESYTYKDISPRPPVNIILTKNVKNVYIRWNKNTEADFSFYKIYKSGKTGFIIDSSKLISSVKDTIFSEGISNSAYYKITAVDNQGNESKPGEEVGYVSTGINEIKKMEPDYRLYNNYPNPFNPSTKIGYCLKEKGWVKLSIYDIKGELIEILVNEENEAGFHELEFNPQKPGNLSSGVYICRIDAKNNNNIPVFSSSNKLIYLK